MRSRRTLLLDTLLLDTIRFENFVIVVITEKILERSFVKCQMEHLERKLDGFEKWRNCDLMS